VVHVDFGTPLLPQILQLRSGLIAKSLPPDHGYDYEYDYLSASSHAVLIPANKHRPVTDTTDLVHNLGRTEVSRLPPGFVLHSLIHCYIALLLVKVLIDESAQEQLGFCGIPER
jgi:hypothetical protein